MELMAANVASKMLQLLYLCLHLFGLLLTNSRDVEGFEFVNQFRITK